VVADQDEHRAVLRLDSILDQSSDASIDLLSGRHGLPGLQQFQQSATQHSKTSHTIALTLLQLWLFRATVHNTTPPPS
jgi:hypothetical protein